MISGVAKISLTKDAHDRRAVAELDRVPNGATTILEVGNRTTIPASTLALLSHHVGRVRIEVHGSAAAVDAWLLALRTPIPW